MSLVPPNAMILPIDTRFTSKTVILPDVATNPGRILIAKDVYGTSGLSSIVFSTLSGNWFEQTWNSTYVGSQPYGAWHLTNDGISRWIFTTIYSDTFYIFSQSSIVKEGLFFSLDGNSYDGGTEWNDTQSTINLTSGLGAANPTLLRNVELQNAPTLNGLRQFFRSYTPIPGALTRVSFTYELWFSNTGTVGALYTEAKNPTTFISTVGQNICAITAGPTIRVGFRTPTGGNINSTTPLSTNTWNQVAWSLSNTTFSLYLNGRLRNSVTNAAYIRSTVDTFYPVVGMSATGFNQATVALFRGSLGSVRLYSTVLSLSSIIQNYNADAYKYGRDQL